MRRHVRDKLGSKMDFSLGKVRAGAHMALSAGLLKIISANHRTRIGRRQDVVNTVATRTVGDDLRSQLGSEPVVTISVTADATAGDAEFLR